MIEFFEAFIEGRAEDDFPPMAILAILAFSESLDSVDAYPPVRSVVWWATAFIIHRQRR
jgi:hypothetical protein